MRTLFPAYALPSPGTRVDADTWVVRDPPWPHPPLVGPPAPPPDGPPTLGRVDLDRGDRPLADVLTDVDLWAAQDVAGLFLDRAPTTRDGVAAVALVVRAARRRRLHRVVLNPGRPTDPRYRDLDVSLCTFEGPWMDYQRWSGDGSQPGDGHLVHAVPTALLTAARELLARRGAAFGVATDAPGPS